MTSINTTQFNPNAAPVNLAGTEATAVIKKQDAVGKRQNELPAIGDGQGPSTVAYSRPSALTPHALSFLTDPSTTDNLSADITSLLVLLIHTQNENRASQRKQWLAQAQNVLSTAAEVASARKEAAWEKFAAESVTNGISLVQNLGSAASSFASAGAGAKESLDIKADADIKFGSDADLGASEEGGIGGIEEEEGGIEEGGIEEESGLENETSFGGLGETEETTKTDTKSTAKTEASLKESAAPKESSEAENTEATEKPTESKAEADSKSGKTESDSEKKTKQKSRDVSNKTNEEKAELRARKAEYIAQKEAAVNSKLDRREQRFNYVSGAIAGLAKEAATGLTVASDLANAEAEQLKGLQDYQSSLASEQLDYANQLRDNATKLLDTLKSIEQARHQAVSAIVNI